MNAIAEIQKDSFLSVLPIKGRLFITVENVENNGTRMGLKGIWMIGNKKSLVDKIVEGCGVKSYRCTHSNCRGSRLKPWLHRSGSGEELLECEDCHWISFERLARE
jgi:hypothetical protein